MIPYWNITIHVESCVVSSNPVSGLLSPSASIFDPSPVNCTIPAPLRMEVPRSEHSEKTKNQLWNRIPRILPRPVLRDEHLVRWIIVVIVVIQKSGVLGYDGWFITRLPSDTDSDTERPDNVGNIIAYLVISTASVLYLWSISIKTYARSTYVERWCERCWLILTRWYLQATDFRHRLLGRNSLTEITQ